MKVCHLLLALASIALVAGCADEPDNSDEHGTVRVRLARNDAQQTDPFIGTQLLQWQVNYDRAEPRCLLNFYLATDPAYQQDGIDGGEIFADWEENSYVCKSSINPGAPDCEVAAGGLEQFFSDSDPTDPTVFGNLRQTLVIKKDDIEGNEIAIGPLPQRSLLDKSCPPKVSFETSSLKGFDGAGNQLWKVTATKDQVMITDQGAAALAEASPF